MLKDTSLETFLSDLASDSPAPGGGSVSALSGGMAAALLAMVCRLSFKRPELADHFSTLDCMISELDALHSELLLLVDKDTAAFTEVMKAFSLPKDTEEAKNIRSSAIQKAFKLAADIPLRTATCCVDVARHGKELVNGFNKNAESDLLTAMACAKAGLLGASSNVRINLSSIKDTLYVSTSQKHLALLESDMGAFAAYVAKKLN